MGTDKAYDYGFGFKVKFDEEQDFFQFVGNLEKILPKSEYNFFMVTELCNKKFNDYFCVVLNSVLPIESLKERSDLLKDILLKDNLIEASQEADLVGGYTLD